MTMACKSLLRKSVCVLLPLVLCFFKYLQVNALGSMSSIAAIYGSNGPAFCGLQTSSDGSSGEVNCFGSNAACVYGAPLRLPLSGLTAGSGFVCGLAESSHLPYCWGNNIYVQQGTPTAAGPNLTYTDICAGDNHLCALRRDQTDAAVDCWGYNITGSFVKGASLVSITAGASFSCGLFATNKTAICWGDETGSKVISEAPSDAKFQLIAAGGYHVCGTLEGSGKTLCWGRMLAAQNGFPGNALFASLVGGKFHACGLPASERTPSCWGLIDPPGSTPTPSSSNFASMVAGDYYTCGLSSSGLQPICWGSQFPVNSSTSTPLQDDCGACTSNCSVSCTLHSGHSKLIQTPIIVGELAIAIVVVGCVLAIAIFLVRYKLAKLAASAASNDNVSGSIKKQKGDSINKKGSFRSSFRKEKVRPEGEEPKMTRAEIFSYQELEQATGGFEKEYEVGKGSFSCVYKGVLSDGRVVAVKRAAVVPSQNRKDSNEFRNELDLLSRLNHAHLLTLLGFCDDGEERLLVYEFMENGTLHEHLHGKKHKGQLGWVRRVTIAVQAARGLEYLHGYACPPVIHRDIKSSNILLDDEWNARVSDFGLSLLGPMDSDSALSELPAGTLGYLDPEYYRLHYLTTKSDVYSFGVLLLEMLSGRKAIDMQYDEGNIVEWAVPLIKSGQVGLVLDPRLDAPPSLEAVEKIARIAARCVKMRGKDRPSMDKVTTSLERALAMLMGMLSEKTSHPILPSEVVLGSNRLHRKSSQKFSCRSGFNVDSSGTTFPDHGYNRHLSSVTFPSISSSQRRGSVSDYDAGGSLEVVVHLADHNGEHGKQQQQQLQRQQQHANLAQSDAATTERKCEIGPASPDPSMPVSSKVC